jgi:hypothetical protein
MAQSGSPLQLATIRLVNAECALWTMGADDLQKAALAKASSTVHEHLTKALAPQSSFSVENLSHSLLAMIDALFWALSTDPRLLEVVSPALLSSGEMLRAFNAMWLGLRDLPRKAKMQADGGLGGHGAIMSKIIRAVFAKRPSGKKLEPKLFKIMTLFGDFYLPQVLGIEDPWGDDLGIVDELWYDSPLAQAASAGDIDLVRVVLSKKQQTDIGEAVEAAFVAYQSEIFELLIQDRNCLKDSVLKGPVIRRMIFKMNKSSLSPSQKELCYHMVERFLRLYPEETTRESGTGVTFTKMDVLKEAIIRRDLRMVKLVMAYGGKIRYEYRVITTGEIRDIEIMPTLFFALYHPDEAILSYLIEQGIFADWNSRYDDAAKGTVSFSLARLAVASFPRAPTAEGDDDEGGLLFSPKHLPALKLALSQGFSHPWSRSDKNALLTLLFDGGEPCPLREEDALTLLNMYHNAGIDVNHAEKEGLHQPMPDLLIHLASERGLIKLVDWCVATLGCSADAFARIVDNNGDIEFHTPLTLAIKQEHLPLASHLLAAHRVKVVYPDKTQQEQPICRLLSIFNDRRKLPLFKILLKAEPSLLAMEPFLQEGGGNPFYLASRYRNPSDLELLCTSGLVGAEDLADRPSLVPPSAGRSEFPNGSKKQITPAQGAAELGNWEELGMLLRHFPKISVLSGSYILGPTGTVLKKEDTILQLVTSPTTLFSGPPPRSLVALVKLRAKKEEEEKASHTKAAATVALGASNTFEDPSSKITSERQEKQKAKKKANKKKARAKKRAKAKEESAGAGKAGDDSDSSHYEGSEEEDDEEEPGKEHLIDSRNAPDLSVMLAARKAAREKEEKEKRDGRGGDDESKKADGNAGK